MCKLCFVGPSKVCWSCEAVRKSLKGMCQYCYAPPCKVPLNVEGLHSGSSAPRAGGKSVGSGGAAAAAAAGAGAVPTSSAAVWPPAEK
mmetsp:Transcript_4998/g.12546  ORF Transcript_4998/g.12546 Transcript_4998/m.12546 type:complete len:88 (-) Transcript_4998:269-532(-)|eukprot:jgi/Tetstr1/440886/TSEL_029158.t1